MPFFINLDVFSSLVLTSCWTEASDFPGKKYRLFLPESLFLDILHTSEMRSSVGISFPLAIKLPERPSSVRISSFLSGISLLF